MFSGQYPTSKLLKSVAFMLLLLALVTFTLMQNRDGIVPTSIQSEGSDRFEITDDSPEYNPEEIRRTQEERKYRLQTACEDLGRTQTTEASPLSLIKQFDNVFVFPQLKLMYCFIPKVGTTSWKRLLLAIHGYPNYINDPQSSRGPHKFANKIFLKLSEMSTDTAERALAEYKSFLFVRNPYTRLLSAFRDKLGKPSNSFNEHFQFSVKRWIREYAPDLALRYPTDKVSFEEFVTHYVKAETKNRHWEDMYELCHPCTLKYDFIGHYDTFSSDTSYLIDQMRSDIRFPDAILSREPTHSSDNNILVKYYARLSDHQLEELSQSPGLARDCKVFGFEMPECIRRNISKTK